MNGEKERERERERERKRERERERGRERDTHTHRTNFIMNRNSELAACSVFKGLFIWPLKLIVSSLFGNVSKRIVSFLKIF